MSIYVNNLNKIWNEIINRNNENGVVNELELTECSRFSYKILMYDSYSGAIGVRCSLNLVIVSNFSVSAYIQ